MKKASIGFFLIGIIFVSNGFCAVNSNTLMTNSQTKINAPLKFVHELQSVAFAYLDQPIIAAYLVKNFQEQYISRKNAQEKHIRNVGDSLNWQTIASVRDVELYTLFTSIDLGGYGENNPPYEPSNPNPPNGAENIPFSLTLSWVGGDPDPEDTLTFDVYFGTDESPPLVAENISTTTYDVNDLSSGTVYYWRVVARDNWNAETSGPVWQFTTIANNPPYEPVNPIPPDHATDVDINADLSWQCNDPDPGDTLTFDVYFGVNADPPLVAENLNNPTYEPGTMNEATTYYWKILARDSHEAETEGPVWTFTTSDNSQPTPTPTHKPCTQYAVQLDMGSNYFCPGDQCYLNAHLCNPGEARFIPLFIILDIEGSYWFAPSWSQDVDYYLDIVPHDWSIKEIIPVFTWPDVDGSYNNINIWGALTNPEITEILGEYDLYTFGYGPCH